jgi:hypothetical protein
MTEQISWEALDDRATRAMEEARFLIAERKRLLDELALHYARTYETARKAVNGVQKTEADLMANARRWLSRPKFNQARDLGERAQSSAR